MIKKGSLTYYLLLALEKSIETGTPFLDFVDNPRKFVWTGYRTNLNYSTLYKSIRQLRLKGYIETEKSGRQIFLKLTDKGRQEIIVKKLLEEKIWDGKKRLVIFDIPEKHRILRRTLRVMLKEWQFIPLQKSVWIGNKSVEKELTKFLNGVGFSHWVKVFVGKESC
ncbi:hypothetical protein A2697_00175 [Candidatus Curtissbacteria bacterium RIFCSPHIGHO2_01_FULL_41_44]|uniref:Transcriptional repressor PaaX-like central Cas2-like domain-containing protein n=1 Tax=Candidatus Curtissbacteria bacterium RIFCSPLOWO2_01_FULL_42_50 TaxID=1797730 RepID=A0A1F5H785_9BACT|nr:MAG: hypothetical protein A3C33_02020 [Candidatus Curtissbacteria bacterium RIFCSPHIGHO2_02_FULL_42_58]OGD94414.1 MAG: hypothetical protein A2697_00175 [Candidatus Curtissbacteria bacterium RIFCSPHIGHO2_01_FULL_41_44]OGD97688.1 MAG: hypothetical protein A3E71_01100 [Candidatus Curtissbacteria bacterium RIFCSPHIGHO2_12_FULL_42_33]OGD99919.1 MAG: hypothetical protein A3B54_00175 [Candidatus Curtissbacteria bacterium RIFCSPLOWO2_01_FULL_42_50]OGE02778.1 MAG: hypothetical protein A3G16_03140 [Ca